MNRVESLESLNLIGEKWLPDGEDQCGKYKLEGWPYTFMPAQKDCEDL